MTTQEFETKLNELAAIDDGQKALVLWLQELVFEDNYEELMEYYEEIMDWWSKTELKIVSGGRQLPPFFGL